MRHPRATSKVTERTSSSAARSGDDLAAVSAQGRTDAPSRLHSPSEWVRLDGRLRCGPKAIKALRAYARRLTRFNGEGRAELIETFRAQSLSAIEQSTLEPRDAQVVRVTISVLCDIALQGWGLRVGRSGIAVAPPRPAETPEEEKGRVRSAHLLERDGQLALPATQRFIREMERRRPTRDGWRSVLTLMRDGRTLSRALRTALGAESPKARAAAVAECVQPYIQIVEPNGVDHVTGLRLMDVWRYFRHTWTTVYNSTPGRKIYILVRDRAVPEHPVIGVAALGSAIVQLSDRDRWIGWSGDVFVENLQRHPSARWARWLDRSLRDLLKDIYASDLVREGVIGRVELRKPTEEAIARLRVVASRSRGRHRLYAQSVLHKANPVGAGTGRQRVAGGAARQEDAYWRRQATTHLFKAKRAAALADLMEMRLRLIQSGFNEVSKAALEATLAKPDGRKAIRSVIRRVRAAHVGIDMLDITVCGALAPYNVLLGGKLVSMLMASPEIVAAYTKRYRDASSVIASAMAGRAVRRRPHLVLLGTTSLYGVASSQYNRVRLPAAQIGGMGDMRYLRIGHTVGFGSYHFSRETLRELEAVAAGSRRGREVNSIFGEGVNPKLRKIRSALADVGLPDDALLQHGSPRLIYMLPLASNFREILLGASTRPKYWASEGTGGTSDRIADYWKERWLGPRVLRPNVLDAVAAHSLACPVTHGARVPHPGGAAADEAPLEMRDLFSDASGGR